MRLFRLTIAEATLIAAYLIFGCAYTPIEFETKINCDNNIDIDGYVEKSGENQKHLQAWPDGIITFRMHDSIDSDIENYFRVVLREIEVMTDNAVMFEETYTGSYEVLVIISGDRCVSTVGFQDYPFVSSSKPDLAIIRHEMCHVLGLFHEFQRYDRDLYVTVIVENIKPDGMYNFEKKYYQLINIEDYPYDYSSIMGYDSGEFTISGVNMTRSDTGAYIEQGVDFSDIDVQKIRYIYK